MPRFLALTIATIILSILALGAIPSPTSMAEGVGEPTPTFPSFIGLALQVDDADKSGEPGVAIVYTFVVRNAQGPSGCRSDLVTFAVIGNSFGATPARGQLRVERGQVRTFAIAVRVPPSADLGDTDEATVAVACWNQPAKRDEVSIQTTVALLLYLPLVSVQYSYDMVPLPTGACAAHAPEPKEGAQAWMSNAEPRRSEDVTLCARVIDSGAVKLHVTAEAYTYFPDEEVIYELAAPRADGVLRARIDVSPAEVEDTIFVDVYFDDGSVAFTSFTVR